MFRSRTTTKKPSNDFYDAFKRSFPNLGPSTRSAPTSATTTTESALSLTIPAAADDQVMDHSKPYPENDKAHDPTFDNGDQWRFGAEMLDANAFSFSQFAAQGNGNFTPATMSMSTMFHSKAGDLHTPGMAFQLGTPLSNDGSASTSAIDMHGFHPHLLHPQGFGSHPDLQQPQTYAPSQFVHRDSGYETMDHSPYDPSNQNVEVSGEPHDLSKFGQYESTFSNLASQTPSEKLRYCVTLRAPTAMIKQVSEIPITYLNKGQAYAITLSDTMGHGLSPGPVKYRTVVRISFEDEQQRQQPSACWQLWKEGRGLAEAHQRGGRLQAVEYVDPSQVADSESNKSKVDLEMASFDSFAVTWSPAPGATTADCTVAVRFNFLSTDFSHSKGVKGIPVRLCAKTEIISSGTPESPSLPTSEVSFCKVKLFRDHGAERKLSNDIAHIKKTIEKLKQQITQVESGIKETGKRKRSEPSTKQTSSHKPGKVQKHKRTWSISSQGSSGRPTIETDLHAKLATMQDMFSSTRPVSVLCLKGYEGDDPDVYPVTLPGEPPDLNYSMHDRQTSWETANTNGSTPTNVKSPASTHSTSMDQRTHQQVTFQKPEPFNMQPSGQTDWDHLTHFSTPNFQFDSTVRIPRPNAHDSVPSWIEACGVDHSYTAPPEPAKKPVACIYVLSQGPCETRIEHGIHKAIYMLERSANELTRSIAAKCEIDAINISRVLRINAKGLRILVDDEVVRQLPEGQDMQVEFRYIADDAETKEQAGSGHTTPALFGANAKEPLRATLEMVLIY